VLGALAWTQLAKMDGFIDRRRRIAAMYRELLPEFWWQTMPPGGSAWLEFVRFPVEPPTDPVELDELGISPKVKRMGDWLFERQIEVRPGFIPLRRHPAFRVPPDGAWTAADDAVWRGLCLPSHPGLDDADVLSVVRAVREAWEVA
jgi:dTDP-4-amino-4,6-dideoxygalactose transaminase